MIYLVRHTRPDVASSVCYGQSDVPLAKSFSDELVVLTQKVTLPAKAIVISSPLQRCLQLATAIFEKSPIEVDSRLLEMCFGDWEMLAWDKVDSVKLTQWADNFVSTPCPNGESLECLNHRVISFWKTLDHLHQDYVLFTHSGVIRVILAHLLNSPLEKAFTLDVDYGEVIRVRFIDGENCKVRFM